VRAGQDGVQDEDPLAAVAELRDEFDEVLAELADEASDYDEYGEWYPDTDELEDLLDEADTLVDQAPDAVRELADHVMELIERVLDCECCFGAELPDALAHAEDLHLDACRAGSPDPVLLAEDLVKRALGSGWGSLDTALPEYADVLGAAGIARCREMLAEASGAEHKLRTLRESLARAERTVG
jgi:hypothetical protein